MTIIRDKGMIEDKNTGPVLVRDDFCVDAHQSFTSNGSFPVEVMRNYLLLSAMLKLIRVSVYAGA